MTKFALRGLTQSINSEWKAKGICSTIVCPGSFKTVPLKTIAGVVQDLLEMPVSAHVPEVIIGGML
jgi:NAD(P)-dependent dehydrogenase (short-subunit alcohol dehydrogenase family)